MWYYFQPAKGLTASILTVKPVLDIQLDSFYLQFADSAIKWQNIQKLNWCTAHK
jgi:hypothetical protein